MGVCKLPGKPLRGKGGFGVWRPTPACGLSRPSRPTSLCPRRCVAPEGTACKWESLSAPSCAASCCVAGAGADPTTRNASQCHDMRHDTTRPVCFHLPNGQVSLSRTGPVCKPADDQPIKETDRQSDILDATASLRNARRRAPLNAPCGKAVAATPGSLAGQALPQRRRLCDAPTCAPRLLSRHTLRTRAEDRYP